MPEGAAFVEDAWTPEAAAFSGEVDGIVTWRLDELPANTIIGPFTFRAAFADEDAAIPLNVAAVATAGEVSADAPLLDHLPYPYTTQLIPRAETASLTFYAVGTEIALPVGETGVWVRIPAGAVSEETTLTVTLLPFEGLPEDEVLWWSSLVRLEADNPIALPVTLLLSAGRTLTPGIPVSLFAQAADGTWGEASDLWQAIRHPPNIILTLQSETYSD